MRPGAAKDHRAAGEAEVGVVRVVMISVKCATHKAGGFKVSNVDRDAVVIFYIQHPNEEADRRQSNISPFRPVPNGLQSQRAPIHETY